MKCTNRNPHYKSTAEFYNTTSQTLTSTATPLNIAGSTVTETGVALDVSGNAATVNYTGTYTINFSIIADITTAGDITAQIYIGGAALPETATTITAAAGSNLININTIRFIKAGCQESNAIQIMINTDGTAARSITKVSGNIIKLA